MRWQAVFFDFDGVILDSVDIKTKAFAGMFREYGPDIEKEVIAYHLENGGISRFDKFRHYYENILGKSVSESELELLGDKFSGLVLKGVLEAPFIAGALDALKQLIKKGIPAYVVSGTPQDEIEYIVIKRKLSRFFKEVHGSPRSKKKIIKQIFKKTSLSGDGCLFIGDAMSDYRAAQDTGVCFLGIINKDVTSPFPQGTITSYSVKIDID